MPISRIKTDGIQDDAITSAKIGDTNVATADIANSSVTTAKIDDDAVTGAKIENNPTIAGTLAVTGHGSVGNAGTVAGTRALTVVGATDGTSSSIIVGYNSSLSSMFSVRDDGYTTVGAGMNVQGNISLASSAGIDFSGSANASGMTSELLDDYEEGDFTPTLSPGSGSYNGLTLTGKYTKVGRLVSVQMNLTITASGNAGGSATVGNLPFASVGSWNRMPNKWRENAATGACGQFTMNHGQAAGFMQNDDGSNIAHITGRVYLINAMYYSA